MEDRNNLGPEEEMDLHTDDENFRITEVETAKIKQYERIEDGEGVCRNDGLGLRELKLGSTLRDQKHS